MCVFRLSQTNIHPAAGSVATIRSMFSAKSSDVRVFRNMGSMTFGAATSRFFENPIHGMTKKKTSISSRTPQVRKDRDYDYVFVNKKKIMLGRSGTPEARAAYVELQAKLLADPSLSSLKRVRASSVGIILRISSTRPIVLCRIAHRRLPSC